MSYKQQVQKLQNDIIENIKRFVEELGQDELHFREMFQVWVTECTFYDDDYIRVSYAAVGLRGEFVICNSEIDEQEIQLGELDIYELAHIMDLLVANQFKTN
jgi:ribosome biogenesis protein Nip4